MVLLMFMLVVMGVKVQSEDTLPTVPVTAMRYQRWRNRTIMQVRFSHSIQGPSSATSLHLSIANTLKNARARTVHALI